MNRSCLQSDPGRLMYAAVAIIVPITISLTAQDLPAEEVKAALYKSLVYRVPSNECAAPKFPDAGGAKEEVEGLNSRLRSFNACMDGYYDQLDADYKIIQSAFKQTRRRSQAKVLDGKLVDINNATAQANEFRKKVDAQIAAHNDIVEEQNQKVDEKNKKVEKRNKLVRELNELVLERNRKRAGEDSPSPEQ